MAEDSQDGSEKDRNAPTVRDLRGPSPVSADTIPDVVGLYVPPRPVPEASRHRTIDLKPVRLSDEADPRRWRTERRLVTPKRPAIGRRALWFTAGALMLLALGAWALVDVTSAPEQMGPAVVAPPPAKAAAAAAPAPSERAPRPSQVTTPAPVGLTIGAPEAKPDAPKAEPSPAKTTRPRESTKKRKDPWLE